jgi:membrane-associated phospholipid phosphatase
MWTQEHEQKEQRRRYLTSAVIAFVFACLITIVLRPWVHWAAPVLRADFQPLFPRYLWGNGVANCFPSHSTLAYFTIAAGFWPIHRRLSLLLMTAALLLISLPRVYEGGHYPIDVVFSCFLGGAALIIFWSWPILGKLPGLGTGRFKAFWEVLLFLWVFELGEAFRGVETLAGSLLRKFSS